MGPNGLGVFLPDWLGKIRRHTHTYSESYFGHCGKMVMAGVLTGTALQRKYPEKCL